MEVLQRSIPGFDLGARLPGRISDNFRDGKVGGQRFRQFSWPSCNAERGVQGQRPWPPGAPPGWPPTTLSFNLGVGGRQPGGHRARKKSPGLCKSTRRALPFVVLKFPRRAMLPRQVMAISSWRLFSIHWTPTLPSRKLSEISARSRVRRQSVDFAKSGGFSFSGRFSHIIDAILA